MSDDIVQDKQDRLDNAVGKDPDLVFSPGEPVACIANATIDLIKMAQSKEYRENTPCGVISGRILSRRLHNEWVEKDGKGGEVEYITYVFEAIKPDGKPFINQQNGHPMRIELPPSSLFKTAESASEFLEGQVKEALKHFATKLNNSVVDANKALNIIRKVKMPSSMKIVT